MTNNQDNIDNNHLRMLHIPKLYSSNEDAWQAILQDCSNAKKSIVLEQFIFVNDELGKKLIDICKERAKNGVKVKFLWDAAGSFTFKGSSLVQELREDGIELVFWKTLIPSYFKIPNFRAWFLRNHRRTLVIDDQIGYTGSICINKDFKNWRDTNVRIQGPVVEEMKNEFNNMWLKATGHQTIKYKKITKDSEFRYITNYPVPGRRKIYSEILKAIRKSKDYVFITTPYFVPTHRLIRTIKAASYRGVDIRIILPEKSDYKAVDLGARAFFKTLLQSGVKIYLYQGNMIHSKSITIDDTWATVGSMNLDSLSLLYNFEANIVTTNDRFAKELKLHFFNDIDESKEVFIRDWQKRFFLNKIMEKLAHLVKKFL